MKKILTLVCVSALGGLLTLGGYKLFVEKNNEQLAVEQSSDFPVFVPTNNTVNAINDNSIIAPNFVTAVEKSLDAVVHVKNTSIVSAPMSMRDLFYGQQSQRAQVGTGSGVIISPTGYIVTNNHVIKNANEISITLNNNKEYMAELIGSDESTDIALLKIETEDEDLPFMAFGDSDNAKIGEWVLAVGNPFNLNSTVTAGIISAKSRDLSGQNTQSFIQTDAAVNPGNSGGALVNTNGDLIGINTAISSRTGSYIGYSFAVPSNIARKIVNDIMEYGNVQNGILGVVGGALNSKFAEEKGLDIAEGFYVSDIQEDTGAEKAGIKSGDIIKKIDNVEINKFSDLSGYLKTKSPDDVVNVTLLRDGDEKILPVTLLKNSSYEIPTIGIVKNTSVKELKNFKLDYGLKISSLTNHPKLESYWRNNGVEEGSIITRLNGKKLYSVDDAKNAIKNKSYDEPLQIEILNKEGEKVVYNFR
ncbi:trypsin-like peptidase domain-containing protein [Winogradskyella echinorum]|uniref:Trypsin-like peptidase domain-containing protein n=1 Tax=Winogradskyella echinorum TaxID=538189 RepID=A0ABR6Y5N0_9FLAO|nr:trypsin-like peptidase domain-containing protein [Winogradskyella echinorum]MBC3848056.1 trypsin-like peptidase domain-containing protein [Winogradskyella echinorum]MBC5752404.1 trypsin-like peptidase domain-containing protein [Winogradskyella echinorum]